MDEKIEELRARLRQAMKKAQELGWTIAQKVTVSPSRAMCCAIGALAVEAWSPWNSTAFDLAAYLGLRGTALAAFMDGFDGVLLRGLKQDQNAPYHKLGQELATEFIFNKS